MPDERLTLDQIHDLLAQHRTGQAILRARQALAASPEAAVGWEALGLALEASGDQPGAARAFVEAMRRDDRRPGPPAWLGRWLLQQGELDQARALLVKACELDPANPQPACDRALAVYRAGEPARAMRMIHELLERSPDFAPAWELRGHFDIAADRRLDARTAYEAAIKLNPLLADAANGLAQLHLDAGEPRRAIACLAPVIADSPDRVDLLASLARASAASGDAPRALATLARAANLAQRDPALLTRLGALARRLGADELALRCLQQAVQLGPDQPARWVELGVALHEAGQPEQAVDAFHRAIQLDPHHHQAHHNLSGLMLSRGLVTAAQAHAREALATQPDDAAARRALAGAQIAAGQIEPGLANLRQVIERHPDDLAARSELLHALHYAPDLMSAELLAEHARHGRAFAPSAVSAVQSAGRSQSPIRPLADRPLRIGYLSADFRRHSVACFLESLLAAQLRLSVEPHLLASVISPDAVTHRLRKLVGERRWLDVSGMNDVQAANAVSRLNLDVLIDLGGHTAGHRLGVAIRRPASLVWTWLGYPDVTGAPGVDARLSDAWADPRPDPRPDPIEPGRATDPHVEPVIHLEGGFLAFTPPSDAPPCQRTRDQGADTSRSRGGPVFGCFNAMPKLNPPLLARWARLLKAVPESRLRLKNASLNDEGLRQDLLRQFASLGVSSERIDLLRPTPDRASHLAAYQEVDVALDTFPYHGTTTTCEALWMGAPVVTLAGDHHHSRVGVSLLQHAGLPELIAPDEEAWLTLAADLARDRDRLAVWRNTLREQFAASPVCDGSRLARAISRVAREQLALLDGAASTSASAA